MAFEPVNEPGAAAMPVFDRSWKPRVYWLTVACTLIFGVLQMIALPLTLTFDGHQYIDSADVLGTTRFSQEWPKGRTPLLPLLMRGSFLLLGRQPLAALVVPCSLGLIGIVVGGVYVRRTAGELPAAVGMVLASLFPTLICYQHAVLSEAGVFCFLSLTLALLLWSPSFRGMRWVQATGLTAVLSAGYYFRQTLLPLAPLAAVLYAWGAARNLRRTSEGAPAHERGRLPWTAGATVLCQAIAIVALPWASARFWQRYGDDQGFGNIVLSMTMVQQALLPPDSPHLGEHAQAYRDAIDASVRAGNLYSGLRYDLFFPLHNKLAPLLQRQTRSIFLECIRRRPGRYLAGMARTAMLFGGARGLDSEVSLHLRCVLNPAWMGERNYLNGGSPRNNHDFTQVTSPSLLMVTLWKLHPWYRYLVIAGSICAITGLLVGLALRTYPLVALCAVPIGYLVPYVLILDCVDRYAMPAQAMVLLNLVAVPVLSWRSIRACYRSRPTPARWPCALPTGPSPGAGPQ